MCEKVFFEVESEKCIFHKVLSLRNLISGGHVFVLNNEGKYLFGIFARALALHAPHP